MAELWIKMSKITSSTVWMHSTVFTRPFFPSLAHAFAHALISSVEEVNDDIKAVCKKVTDAANNLIQRKKGKKSSRVKDPTMSYLC